MAESDPLLMSMVHCDEVEPHVLTALHMFSVCASSHAYLPLFCACAVAQFHRRMQHNNGIVVETLKCSRIFIIRILRSRSVVAICLTFDSATQLLLPRDARHCELSIPLEDVSQSPRVLIKLPLQLSFLVDDELRGREKNPVTFIPVFIVYVEFTSSQIKTSG